MARVRSTEFHKVDQVPSDLLLTSSIDTGKKCILSWIIDRRFAFYSFYSTKYFVSHSNIHMFVLRSPRNERAHSATTMTMTLVMNTAKNEARAQPASALTLAPNCFEGRRGSSLELYDGKRTSCTSFYHGVLS